ncbi:MAG: protein kinase, partial [Gemmatimonadetes bacterium]|nr:protein kinase [Gemmatimonadota bacterium]
IPVTPPAVRPAPAPQPRVVETPAAPATSADAGDYPTPACASPAMADQRRCLLAYLARSDVTLDRNYQAEIRRRRAEAGTPAGAREPESVQRLRSAQRAWLVYRDTECRNRNRGREGPLWAPVRARCLGEFSQARAEELAH